MMLIGHEQDGKRGERGLQRILQVLNILGLGPVPWALVGEVFPSEVKGLATAMVTVVLSVGSTVVAKLFQVLSDGVGMHVVFFSFSACATMGLLFTFFFVPETKGRSFLEIMSNLEGRTNSPECVPEKQHSEGHYNASFSYEMEDMDHMPEKQRLEMNQLAIQHLPQQKTALSTPQTAHGMA